MAITGQRNKLAVKVAVRTGSRIKTLPFTIQTQTVFDGKSLLGKAGFMRLSGHQQVSRSLTVKPDGKAVRSRRKPRCSPTLPSSIADYLWCAVTLIPHMLEAFIAGDREFRRGRGGDTRPTSRAAVLKGWVFGYVVSVVSRLRLETPYQIDFGLEKL